jgi:hypothetical protein
MKWLALRSKIKIFLTYASEDQATAESMALSLRARGYVVFFDRDDLPPGESFDQRIERAVDDSDFYIFVISADAVAEGRYTLTELSFARRKWPNPNYRVLPVMVRKTPRERVPSYLKAVTILEPQGNVAAETSAAIEALRRSVEKHLTFLERCLSHIKNNPIISIVVFVGAVIGAILSITGNGVGLHRPPNPNTQSVSCDKMDGYPLGQWNISGHPREGTEAVAPFWTMQTPKSGTYQTDEPGAENKPADFKVVRGEYRPNADIHFELLDVTGYWAEFHGKISSSGCKFTGYFKDRMPDGHRPPVIGDITAVWESAPGQR